MFLMTHAVDCVHVGFGVVTSEHWHMHLCILFEASGGVKFFHLAMSSCINISSASFAQDIYIHMLCLHTSMCIMIHRVL